MPTIKREYGKLKAKPTFFKKGTVVYSNSGHALHLSNGYYRCSLNCRKELGSKESQVEQERLHRDFSRIAKRFAIGEDDVNAVLRQLMQRYFVNTLFDIDEKTDSKGRIINANIVKMKADIKRGEFVKRDVTDSFDRFMEISKDEYPFIMFCYAFGVIGSLSALHGEREIGQVLAAITKHVYISDIGIVEKIEFEPWGWYILNFMEKQVPNYLWSLKKHGVDITNDHTDQFLKKDFSAAIAYFESEGFEEALHNDMTQVLYKLFSLMRDSIRVLLKGDTASMQKAYTDLVERFKKDPVFKMAMMLPALGSGKIKL